MSTPYTDDDLRTEAARIHRQFTAEPDEGLVGEVMESGHVRSVETSEDGSARTWPELLEPDGEETPEYAQAQRAVTTLIRGAADTSEWAVNLGADSLQPHARAIDIGWNDGPLQARIHIAFPADTPADERDQFVTDIADAIAGTVPVR
jgi:hypothetical protein